MGATEAIERPRKRKKKNGRKEKGVSKYGAHVRSRRPRKWEVPSGLKRYRALILTQMRWGGGLHEGGEKKIKSGKGAERKRKLANAWKAS